MQEFELRMYDPRIGRWMSPDPYGQFASPYLAMGNTPHLTVDSDGGWIGPGDEIAFEVVGRAVEISATAIPSAAPVFFRAIAVATPIALQKPWAGPSPVDNRSAIYKFFEGGAAILTAFYHSASNGALPKHDFGPEYKLQYETGDKAGVMFQLLAMRRMGPGSEPTPVLATPSGNFPVTQPMVVAPTRVTDVHGQLNAKGKLRSYENPIGRRIKFSSRKKAYEAAKRSGKGEPVLHGDGEHGPHYHPGDGKGNPLNHDHYYFPKNQY